MKKISVICLLLFTISVVNYGQDQPNYKNVHTLEQKQQSAQNAADQKTNFKSITTDLLIGRYYQALVKNGILKQSDSEIKFKSTIYGLMRIFDTTLSERNYFTKNRLARNITIGTGASLGDGNKITDINSSLSIAILNNREYKGKENLFDKNNITVTKIVEATSFVDIAIKKVQDLVNEKKNSTEFRAIVGDELKKKKIDEYYLASGGKQLQEFSDEADFDKLKGLITDEQIKQSKEVWGKLANEYDEIQRKLSGGALLTYSYEGNYNGEKWSKLNNHIEFIKGFGNKKDSIRKYDFYAGLLYDLNQDSLNKLSSLNRKVFNFKLGVNSVLLRDRQDGSSIVEAFGGVEYQNISKGLYSNEKENALKFDVTLSFKVAPKLYLPFQVKFNQTTGRFEGYLDLKLDIISVFK